jgi:hypothetical protein
MRRRALWGALVLLLVLVGCAPQVETEDPNASYKQSLLPAFRGDIASLGDIPRYRIVVNLDADALTLAGRQQVLYINNEGDKLGNFQRMGSG